MRHGTFADAHPPRDNLTFQEKCWKGVPKSSPELILGRFWHTLPQLLSKKQVLTWRVCVRARSLTHTLRVRISVCRKSAGRVCQNQPQASKKPLKTYMGAQSTKSRIYCFSYSRMVAAISRRVFRCFEKVVRSRPDRPTNAIAQPDRPDIDRKSSIDLPDRPPHRPSSALRRLTRRSHDTIRKHHP